MIKPRETQSSVRAAKVIPMPVRSGRRRNDDQREYGRLLQDLQRRFSPADGLEEAFLECMARSGSLLACRRSEDASSRVEETAAALDQFERAYGLLRRLQSDRPFEPGPGPKAMERTIHNIIAFPRTFAA